MLKPGLLLIAALVPVLALAQSPANPTSGAALRRPADAKALADAEKAKNEESKKEKEANKADAGVTQAKGVDAFAQFGFAPALYLLHYRQPVLNDAKDVRLRSDGVITASGSRTATALGVELHFGSSTYNKIEYEADNKTIRSTGGHTYTPYIGMFDLDEGVNGLALGVMYSYWRGNDKFERTSALSVGLGYTVHKNRLVLANGLSEGVAPPVGLAAEDYTRRKDVKGLTLTVSVSYGF